MTHNMPYTLRSLSGAPSPRSTLDGAALVVIDAQREYTQCGALPVAKLDPALRNISDLQAAARRAQAPVLHVAHVGRPGGMFDPSAGGRFIDLTGPKPDEAIIAKSLPNSFSGTDLHNRLGELGITHIVLAGFMTHMCVSSTARAALDLGYTTTIVADACATRDLPGTNPGDVVDADDVNRSALAALADRFGDVVTTVSLTTASAPD